MIKRKRSTGWLAASSLTLLMLALAGCGGSSSDTAGTDPASSKSTATGSITATDGNSGASALSLSAPAGVTLSIPANTAFTDSTDSPVTGSIATTISYSNQVADLPVAARTVPAGSNLVAFADISMVSGAANVKSFSNPAALVFKVPVGVAATGDVLTVYSFDSSSAKWNFAGSEIVDADGNISPSVRHLSIWGLFKSATPPPVKPSGIAAAAGDGQVSLTWSAINGATSYNVYYAASAGVTPASETKVVGAVSGQAITGLANGTAYYFVVSAVNAAGESVTSNEVSASPVPPLPVRPSGLVVSGGDGQVTISWTVVSGATTYNVYWGTATGVTPGNGTKISNFISGQTLTGLTNGTAYFFVVTAENTAGEGVPSTQKSVTPAATPQAPGSPTGVTLAPGAGQVTISWAPVPGATSFNVYYLQSVSTPTTATVIGTGTKVSSAGSPATVSDLATGGSYWFTVTAVNVGGESAGQTNPKKALPL